MTGLLRPAAGVAERPAGGPAGTCPGRVSPARCWPESSVLNCWPPGDPPTTVIPARFWPESSVFGRWPRGRSYRNRLFRSVRTLAVIRALAGIVAAALLVQPPALAAEWSGFVSGQHRYFFEDPLDPRQHNSYLSAAARPEFYHRWDDSDQSFNAILFYRVDQHDDNRTHGDVREFSWTRVFEHFEMTAGISKVFWGVTETQHLVDIINQTDLVENVDGEDKLGQPMIRVSTLRDWGTLDFFALPWFRERTFAGPEGRPRPDIVIDTDRDPIYDFEAGRNHIDLAVRYSHFIGEWEFGLSYFSGVDRLPSDFVPVTFAPTGQPTSVVPVYSLINQAGVDGQVFFGDWTWKLEAINKEYRSGRRKGSHTFQSVFGFEYTWVGFTGGASDLGFVVEYHYSDGNKRETIFDNDLATALRFVLNDAQSTEVLAGFLTDKDTTTVAAFIEASRRIGQNWLLEAELRTWSGTVEDRPLFSFRFDDFLQLDLAYYF